MEGRVRDHVKEKKEIQLGVISSKKQRGIHVSAMPCKNDRYSYLSYQEIVMNIKVSSQPEMRYTDRFNVMQEQ